MTLKPPTFLSDQRLRGRAAVGLDYEIAQEKAASLGRVGRRLEEALAALKALDASTCPAGSPTQRARLVAEAAEALWMLAVQREAVGCCDLPSLLREYGVPREVASRMGPAACN
jgi:hypothetical protein